MGKHLYTHDDPKPSQPSQEGEKDKRNIGLESARVVAQPSQTIATLAGRPDIRDATDMWSLLRWAYGREQVRFSAAEEAGAKARQMSGTGWAMQVLANGARVSGGGGSWQPPSCHIDALAVHALVRNLSAEDFWIVVRSAEHGRPPEWNPEIVPARLIAMRRANGRPEHVLDRRGKTMACVLRLVGTTPAQAEMIRHEARALYRRWRQLLVHLRGDLTGAQSGLTRWRVEGIGVEAEPWRTGCGRDGLTSAGKT